MIDRQRFTAWIVLAVSLVSLVMAAVTSIQSYRQAACQANYNEINNQRTRILTDVGAKEREAERRRDAALDATFLDPSVAKPVSQRTPEDQHRVQALFAEYLDAARAVATERAAADEARAANPVPPPPSAVCG
jgi:ABC-type transporter MlaC component